MDKEKKCSRPMLDPGVIQKKEKRAHGKTLSAALSGAIVSAMTAVPVFAKGEAASTSTDDTWKNIGQGLVKFIDGIKPFVIAIIVLALVVDGVGCIIGGEQSREKFKRALPWIVGGSVIILLAGAIAQKVANISDNAGKDYEGYVTMIQLGRAFLPGGISG